VIVQKKSYAINGGIRRVFPLILHASALLFLYEIEGGLLK
jgi:hypothetical protein